MGELASGVTVQIIGRMFLVHLLVFVTCLTGCVGARRSPLSFSNTLDTFGRLETPQRSSEDESLGRLAKKLYQDKQERYGMATAYIFRKNELSQNRTSILKMLIENLTKLQHYHVTETPNRFSEEVQPTFDSDNIRGHSFRGTSRRTDPFSLKTVYKSPSLLPQKSWKYARNRHSSTAPVEVIAKIELLIPSPDGQQTLTYSTCKTPEGNGKPSSAFPKYFLGRKETVLEKNYIRSQDDRDFYSSAPKIPGESGRKVDIFAVRKKSRLSSDKNALIFGSGKKPSTYLSADLNSFNENSGSFYVKSVLFNTQSPKSLNNEPVEQFNHFKLATMAGSSPTGDFNEGNEVDSVETLIHRTVKKMEHILEKRIHQNKDIFPALQYKSQSGSLKFNGGHVNTGQAPSDVSSTNSATKQDITDSVMLDNSQVRNDDESKENRSELLLRKPQGQDDHAGDITTAVIKAVASGKVPKDSRFWKGVSEYLDSDEYLRRIRRSPQHIRKQHYVHVSITYGHVVPCEYKDRFYCMNGGTCVFVGALDIKTCR